MIWSSMASVLSEKPSPPSRTSLPRYTNSLHSCLMSHSATQIPAHEINQRGLKWHCKCQSIKLGLSDKYESKTSPNKWNYVIFLVKLVFVLGIDNLITADNSKPKWILRNWAGFRLNVIKAQLQLALRMLWSSFKCNSIRAISHCFRTFPLALWGRTWSSPFMMMMMLPHSWRDWRRGHRERYCKGCKDLSSPVWTALIEEHIF